MLAYLLTLFARTLAALLHHHHHHHPRHPQQHISPPHFLQTRHTVHNLDGHSLVHVNQRERNLAPLASIIIIIIIMKNSISEMQKPDKLVNLPCIQTREISRETCVK